MHSIENMWLNYNIVGSSAATPVTSTNTSPVSGRTSVFQQQNDNNSTAEVATKDNAPPPVVSTIPVNSYY